ncbi:MAG TPA: DUF2330 domain-containing protein [Candidatus Binataceae bacterium]|nr:DUF2330 domain-containing protein [Candidatus Binataceae bacterium]
MIAPSAAHAFCGFYVGKSDTSLYNHASQVVMVRNGDKTVLSLMNDYQGEPSEFALVVPVPEVLQREQIHVGDRELFKRLDAYSSPRLVEYYDEDPCRRAELFEAPMMAAPANGIGGMRAMEKAKSLGVTVEAQYTVGEYDIVILSAKQSDGLEQWLHLNGYHIPLGAARALKPYLRQDMKFFVAKVNLKEHAAIGLSYLRPLQFAFSSPKFMLPIRLGMLNAQGPQDLVIYALTQNGRVETTNYRTQKLPTDIDLPGLVRDEFPAFYKDMFDHQVKLSAMSTVFTEYAWNMGWCDPCAAEPLAHEELHKLGVFWLNDTNPAMGGVPRPMFMPAQGAVPVMITRLHVRYSADTFPEDLVFQKTQDTENYQARYVLHRPWQGSPNECAAAKSYFEELDQRRQKEAQNLADLTGWEIEKALRKAGLNPSDKPSPWWHGLWD